MSTNTVARKSWRRALIALSSAIAVLLLLSNALPAQTTCENLRNLVLPDTSITVAESLPAGSQPASASDLITVPICRVVAHIRPSSDSDIVIEAWLPSTTWNGRFLGTGTGLFSGQITYSELLNGIKRGYATVATDTGHQSAAFDASWALGHPEKLTDFMYRSIHEMTVKGKQIAQAYYGQAAGRSYFTGCSTAGKQGLTEAQLYPQDYDGITISAPVNNWTHQQGAHLYNALAALKNGTSAPEYIPPDKWTLMANAALALCDGRDGVEDGLIGDPSSCNFDPATLLCRAGDGPNCLTAAQLTTANKIYAGAKFSNGQRFYPGLPPSSEIIWAPILGGPEPYAVAPEHFKFFVFGNPGWNWRTFSPDTDVALADSSPSAALNATNPNLDPFRARGGKLIIWHGWLDTAVFAKNSVDYYQSVVSTLGPAATDSFFRLFMAPGVAHCGSGPGPNIIDGLPPLEKWVEQGIAPAQIEALHFTLGFANGEIDRRRPLCPYPQVADYLGSGNINVAENFRCDSPAARFTFDDRGGTSLASAGRLADPVSVGYATIKPDAGNTAPSGLAIFALRQNNVLISEASVPASPLIQSGRIYAEVNTPVNTGIAIANPNSGPATISFYFTDQSGNFGNGSTQVPAGGHVSAFLDQSPFNARTIQSGSFTFTSSVPVSVVGLRGLTNERGEFLITTLPVADLNAPPPTGTLILPHYVNGGGWTTQVTLVNPTDNLLSGSVQFIGSLGQPGPSTPYTISPRAVAKVQATGLGDTVVGGSVRVVPSGNVAPSAFAVFSFRNGNGITVTEASVLAVAAGTSFRLYAEASGNFSQGAGSMQTGIAVHNTSANAAVVNVEVYRLDGPTGFVGSINVPPNGQNALFLNQIPGLASLPLPFKGVLKLTSTEPISVLGLRARYNERNDFLITTTLPVNEAVAATNTPLYFPHLADGGGYTTQFIVFSGRAGQSSAGTITFSTPSGTGWNLFVR